MFAISILNEWNDIVDCLKCVWMKVLGLDGSSELCLETNISFQNLQVFASAKPMQGRHQ